MISDWMRPWPRVTFSWSPILTARFGFAPAPFTVTLPPRHAFCASERVLNRQDTSSQMSSRTSSPATSVPPVPIHLAQSHTIISGASVTATRFVRSLYGQVLIATLIGVALGHFFPAAGVAMRPLGDGFIKLVRMMIAPIIFCSVVAGVAGVGDAKAVGKAGGLALVYFEILSTLALIIGLVVVNVVRPGAGMNI